MRQYLHFAQRSKTIRVILISIYLLLSVNISQAQSSVIRINDKIPEFELTDVTNYKRGTFTSKETKGKWLVLEFWAPFCFTCVRTFPKADSIQTRLKDNLNWVLVGMIDERNKDTKEFYLKAQARHKLNLISAFDKKLYQEWDIHTIPTILIIDPDGIVKAYTHDKDITLSKMTELMNGKDVFSKKAKILSAFNSSSDTQLEITRSVIAPWNGEPQNAGWEIDYWVQLPAEETKKGFTIAKADLGELYIHAFVGKTGWLSNDPLYSKVYPYPILKISDSSLFQHDYKKGTGMYNYNLKLPQAKQNVTDVKRAMQEDLERAFGYEATLQDHSVPVYRLVAGPNAGKKLASKGGPQSLTKGTLMYGFTATNYPKYKLINLLTFFLTDRKELLPYLNDIADLPEFIDITIEGDLSTLEGVQKAIKPYDMQIVKSSTIMKAIVIDNGRLE